MAIDVQKHVFLSRLLACLHCDIWDSIGINTALQKLFEVFPTIMKLYIYNMFINFKQQFVVSTSYTQTATLEKDPGENTDIYILWYFYFINAFIWVFICYPLLYTVIWLILLTTLSHRRL